MKVNSENPYLKQWLEKNPDMVDVRTMAAFIDGFEAGAASKTDEFRDLIQSIAKLAMTVTEKQGEDTEASV